MTTDEIRAELQAAIRSDKRAAAILRKIAAGRASFTDTMNYSLISGRLTGQQLSAVILELSEGREELAEALLHDRYEDINAQCAAVQTSLDEKNGLHLAPQKAPFPSDRVAKFVHSLVDPTVKDETIERRARSASENITVTFHDDFIAENAEFRDRAGIECFVERITDGSCCPWCNKVAGRYRMQDQPEGLFSRHDNCGCTIIYDGQVLRGQIGENGRRGRRWVEQPPKVEYQKPTVLSRSEAERLQAERLPRRLTGVADSAIIEFRENGNIFYRVTDDAIKNIPSIDLFGKENAEKNAAHQQASKDLLTEVARHPELEAGTEFSIVYDADMKPIDGYGYVQGEVGKTKIDNPGVPYHAFHNHGSDNCLSYVDLTNFVAHDNMLSLTAQGNLGSTYTILATSEADRDSFFEFIDVMSQEPVGELNGKTLTLDYIYNDPSFQNEKSNIPEEELNKIMTAVSDLMEQILKGSEDHGFKYFISKVANA